MNTFLKLTGVIAPLLTPFTDNGERVDEGALRAHVEWLICKGIHGLMPCGTTGEGPLLSVWERKRVVEIVVATVAGRVPVIAHVGTAVTGETIELACHAQHCGVDAISVVTPFYFRLSEGALVEHHCRVADAVPDMAMFLYNIPQCTGNGLSRSTAEVIIERCPNVVGIKDSSGSLETLASFVGLKDGQFQVVCGSDGLLSDALEVGACASVSGNANAFPEVLEDLFDAFRAGDRDAVRRQQTLLDEIRTVLQDGQSISLIKRALELRGLTAGAVRSPLPEATARMVANAERRLRELQLLR